MAAAMNFAKKVVVVLAVVALVGSFVWQMSLGLCPVP